MVFGESDYETINQAKGYSTLFFDLLKFGGEPGFVNKQIPGIRNNGSRVAIYIYIYFFFFFLLDKCCRIFTHMSPVNDPLCLFPCRLYVLINCCLRCAGGVRGCLKKGCICRLHPEMKTSFCNMNSIDISPSILTNSLHENSEKLEKSQQNDRPLMFYRTKTRAPL